MRAFLQDFTGLQNPAELGEVAGYFNKTARVWVSPNNKTRAVWLDYDNVNDDFYLSANDFLYVINAARGVAS